MSLIDFESSNEIKKKRNWEREVRNSILEKAKKKYECREKKELEAKERGEDKWLLPSVEATIQGKKSRKDKKYKKEKKVKKKKRKRDKSSSSSSDDNEELWVEKKDPEDPKLPELSINLKPKREEWMEVTSLFGTYSRDDLRSEKIKKDRSDGAKQEDAAGGHHRELNPYYKRGGSGLPSHEKHSASLPNLDASWLRKALRRAEDQAKEEGKSLEEVASNRWGSLEKFYSLLHEAEKYEGVKKENRDEHAERGRYKKYQRNDREERRSGKKQQSHERYSNQFSKDLHEKKDSSRAPLKGLMRPPRDDEELKTRIIEKSSHTISQRGNSLSSWRKKTPAVSNKVPPPSSSSSSSEDEKEDLFEKKPIEVQEDTLQPLESKESPQVLTEKEMNHLAAKMTKAELVGNEPLASKLRAKLEAARAAREKNATASIQKSSVKQNATEEEMVLLTRTDARGIARPIRDREERDETRGKKRSKPRLLTHDADGQRTIYFPDDERYNLKQMFEKEKGTTAADQNLLFERAASATVERLTEDFDMDDAFVSRAALKESHAKQLERDRKMAIKEHQTSRKILENCRFCIDNKEMKKHLIISLGTKCYLSLPGHEPLTEGHCIITPVSHVPSSTRADEDLWQEVMDLRRCLVKMFEAKDQDCVFFETCLDYKNLPHMAIHCVPLSKEDGDLAPIYFKKAIQECEEEWAQNKKLVDLKGRDVRRAVPKELPYFFVDFGLSPGFAHVIEDQRTFRSNFAQEIIGGMMDAEPRLWRKPKYEPFEAQRKRVVSFAESFGQFDPNVR